MKNTMRFICFLFLSSILFSSCGDSNSDLVYEVTIMEPTSANKMLGEDMHVHVNFDEVNGKRIQNIRVVIKTVGEGLIKYDTGVIKALTDGHFEHHTDFSLDVTPNSSLVLEASAFTDDAIDDETLWTKSSVEFQVVN